MKKFIFLFFVSLCSVSTYAQESSIAVNLQEWASTLNLDALQNTKVSDLEIFRNQQIQELNSIKTHDEVLYNNKLQAIHTNTSVKFQNILHLEQLNVYQRQLEQKEKEKIVLATRMKAKGASKADIDDLLNN